MEGEHDTMILLVVGASKKLRFMGEEADEYAIAKHKPVS